MGAAAVDGLLDAQGHPRRAVIDALRAIVLGVDPRIEEGVKWNSASFRAGEWFATCNARPMDDCVRLVFHRGAKAKPGAKQAPPIDAPEGFLEWHAADRCSATFRDEKSVKTGARALRHVVRQWIAGA